jgi:hypothetical protein
MSSSRRDPTPEREIQRALSSDVSQKDTIEREPAQIPSALLLAVHLTQTAVAAIFCLVCYWAYRGTLPSVLAQGWTACLVLMAVVWMGALPMFCWFWRFAPVLEKRLSFWALYALGVLALPLLVAAVAVVINLRSGQGLAGRSRAHVNLLAGVITTWPLMHFSARFACEKALPMTLAEESALSPYWSFVLVYGTCLVLPIALIAVALHVRRRRLVHAANARNLAAGTGVLMPGEAIVTGAVELAEGETQAVELQIDQVGTEQESSGTWSHTWTETRRRLTVRPFYLRTGARERVRVLAGDDARLMDALDGKILVNRTARTCTAELTPGEVVSAFGQLSRGRDPEAAPQGGYRSGAIGWVMRSPEGGRILLSSYPIDRPFTERASRIMGWVVALVAVVISGQLSLLGYHLRVAGGEQVSATVVDARVVREKTEDGYTLKRMVTLSLADREDPLTAEVTEKSYATLSSGQSVSVVMAPVFSSFNFGEHPTVSFWILVEVGLVVLICFFLAAADRPDARWYLESKVVEEGSGRLPDVKPTTTSKTGMSEIRALVDQEFRRRS